MAPADADYQVKSTVLILLIMTTLIHSMNEHLISITDTDAALQVYIKKRNCDSRRHHTNAILAVQLVCINCSWLAIVKCCILPKFNQNSYT